MAIKSGGQSTRLRLVREVIDSYGITQFVFLASTFRSGSSYAGHLLWANGLDGLHLEKFAVFERESPETDQHFMELVEQVFSTAHGSTFTSKFMWSHLEWFCRLVAPDQSPEQTCEILFKNSKWLYIERQDKIDQAISFWRAKQTDLWHVFEHDEQKNDAVEYDFCGISNSFEYIGSHYAKWAEFFNKTPMDHIHFIYEVFSKYPEILIVTTENFLGIDFSDPLILSVSSKIQRDEYSLAMKEMFLNELNMME